MRRIWRALNVHLDGRRAAGDQTPHELRHASATLFAADAAPVTAFCAMLGHALTSTTLNAYAHMLPGAERVTADAMERHPG